ncbi:MAG: hypothetical protein QM844_22575 [Planctomycetota bacterium]|nr:hypothetical protein [Planctomycetota bacterium]
MTVVVSDTGPLNYLVLCGAIDILPRLFETVVVPAAVLAELEHEDTPAAVRRWAGALPSWVEVRTPRCPSAATKLDWGEREAIFLALEVKADLVLIDDRAARRATVG